MFFAKPALAALTIASLIGCQAQQGRELSVQEKRISTTQAKIDTCVVDRCDAINLDSGLLDDFGQLASLDHVTNLRMSWTDFDDLADIAPMTQLRELHISSTQISNLDGLAAFDQLETLHVQWSRNITDFSPIGAMTGVRELALGGNDVGDMAFVALMQDLGGLSLTSAKVSSFEALRDHPGLTRLDLEMTDLPDDISPLLTVANLKQVSVRANDQTDAQRAVLDQLRARGVQVEDILDAVVVIC